MDKKITLAAPAVLSFPLSDAEKLLAAGNSDAALVYIYILKNGGLPDEKSAALALGRTEGQILSALRALISMGILSGSAAAEKPLAPARELPEVNAEDIVRRTKDAPDFKVLVSETQQIYGRNLSTSELNTLFNLYDYLALPPEVILLLIHHCEEQCLKRFGPGKKFSFRTLEKRAYEWVEQEVITYERAEQWLAEAEKRNSLLGEMSECLGIRGRELTQTERRYMESWLSQGFTPAAAGEALERTVANTGGVKWRYMDGIMKSWHSKNLHTLEAIRQGDRKPLRTEGTTTAQGPTAEEFERMKKLREKVRNG